MCRWRSAGRCPPFRLDQSGGPAEMAIVADMFDHVVGVDTHARTHTYCVVHCRTGAVLDSATFPASTSGCQRALTWIRRRAAGRVLAAVEGTSSYGAKITAILQADQL